MDPMGLVKKQSQQRCGTVDVFPTHSVQNMLQVTVGIISPYFLGIKKIHIKKSVRFFHHLGVGRFGDFSWESKDIPQCHPPPGKKALRDSEPP